MSVHTGSSVVSVQTGSSVVTEVSVQTGSSVVFVQTGSRVVSVQTGSRVVSVQTGSSAVTEVSVLHHHDWVTARTAQPPGGKRRRHDSQLWHCDLGVSGSI